MSGEEHAADPDLLREAYRKAKGSTSRKTGRPVVASHEELTIKGNLGPAQITFTMRAPPQLVEDRANRLALFHLKAFFYWLTYYPETNLGGYWEGQMFPLNGTTKQDFGNVVQTEFAKHVSTWDLRLVVTTADSNYQAAIRRHPTAAAWSFAFEWNRNYRLIGFFGDISTCESECDALPKLEPDFVHEDGPRVYAGRKSRMLDATDDLLFLINE